MLSKRTHLLECKAKEDTSLDEHFNESIVTNVYLILMMRLGIIYWSIIS